MTHPLFAPDIKFDEPYWWETATPPEETAPDLPASVDVAIVGGGYTGLSAALTLLGEGREVAVFDAERAGWGCSSRNGGQIGIKLRRSLDDVTRSYGRERAIAMVREKIESRAYVAQLVESEGLDCDFTWCGRFLGAFRPGHYETLSAEVGPLQKELGEECHMVPRSDQRSELGTDAYFGGQVLPRNASLDPGKFAAELARVVLAKGGRVLDETPVAAVERDGDGFTVTTTRGKLKARNVIVATNGYTGEMFPDLRRRLIPIGSYVIATEPLPPGLMDQLMPKRRVTSDTRRVVHYYRPSPDGTRIIWGGRVAASETDCRVSAPRLHAAMCAILPEMREVRISHSWMGFVAYTFNHLPAVGVRDGIHYSMGYCGSGASMAPWLGHKVALKLLGKEKEGATAFDDVKFETRPLYTGTPWFLAGAVLWYRFLDRVGR